LWLIFAATKRGLNLEKSCQKNTIGCGQWASSAERTESRRAAADLEKSQARREMDCPIPLASRKIMLVAPAARTANGYYARCSFEHGQLVFASQKRPSSIN
jgi:hypothetical protein